MKHYSGGFDSLKKAVEFTQRLASLGYKTKISHLAKHYYVTFYKPL